MALYFGNQSVSLTSVSIGGTDTDGKSAYHFKGSVVDEDALNDIIDANVGDVYNIESTDMNAAWTGTEWDNLGSVVDLSEYIKITDLHEMTDEEINALFT